MTGYNQNQVEGLVLIRDGAQMIADGVNKLLEGTEPQEKRLEYDLMKVVTQQTEGAKGYYLKASPEDNQNNRDFELLIEDLKQHDGKLTKQGYFCWLFSDKQTAGMKKSNR
jgi:hypothetical protein